MKINESLSEKMSKLEEGNEPNKANKKHKETTSNTKIANGKKKVKTRNKKDSKKDNLKGNNLIEKKREIHEAYQVVLNEYHRKLDLRRKSLDQTNTFRRRSILHAELKAFVKDASEAVDGMYHFVLHENDYIIDLIKVSDKNLIYLLINLYIQVRRLNLMMTNLIFLI